MFQACAPRYVYFSINKRRLEPVGTCFTAMDSFSRFSEYSPCRTGITNNCTNRNIHRNANDKLEKLFLLDFLLKPSHVKYKTELSPAHGHCWAIIWQSQLRRWDCELGLSCFTKFKLLTLSNFSCLGIPQTRILPGGVRCSSNQGKYIYF